MGGRETVCAQIYSSSFIYTGRFSREIEMGKRHETHYVNKEVQFPVKLAFCQETVKLPNASE